MQPTTATTSSTAPAGTARRTRPIWLVGAVAGLTAAVATELYGLAARATDIPMEAGNPGAAHADPVLVGMFAMGTVICTFWGTLLAVLLARYAKRPARTFVWATVALTALSLVSPLAAGHTATSTKLMLAGAHLIAAAIVIPVLARRLDHAAGRQERPRPAAAAPGQPAE